MLSYKTLGDQSDVHSRVYTKSIGNPIGKSMKAYLLHVLLASVICIHGMCIHGTNARCEEITRRSDALNFDAEAETSDGNPPNVIVFISDDQGWGDFGFQGNSNFVTPNIDRLAKEGTVCTRFYVCPVCAPTRAEFLTGRYHPRGGALGVTQGEERLDLDEVTLADRLSRRGYATGAFGKWHNGSQYPYHPNARGFDEFYGFCSGHWGDYFSPPLEHNGNPIRGNGFVADDFTDHALSFINEHRDRPFFCYVAFNTPHTPMQVPEAYFDRVKTRELQFRHEGRKGEKEDDAMTRAAIAMVENIDTNVGRVLDHLDQLELTNQTIVFYFNDNGPNSYRWNAGMKGRKGSTDEGGVRSPLLARWPGVIPSQRTLEQLSGAIDLVPTICDWIGDPMVSPSTSGKPLDGISLASLLTDPSQPTIERSLFTQWGGKIAMRHERFLFDANGGLFDLYDDPTQSRDLRERLPEKAELMQRSIATWKRDVLDPGPSDRPFLVGHPKRQRTELPAQDGKCSGPSVRRSNTAPNCSYFSGMTSRDDEVFWKIQTLQEGLYDVVIQYTAPENAIGVEVECDAGRVKTKRAIKNAFTSLKYGDEHDRVPRQTESLMKEFKSMSLGQISLEAETMTVRLRLVDALKASLQDASSGLEIRAIELIRQ